MIPVKKGLVIDFYRMKDVLSVDKKNRTVTTEPGITWEQLDTRIKKEGLTLRLYPTSYPSSTVGGWLAQGGAGLGSYEHGYFHENVISANAVCKFLSIFLSPVESANLMDFIVPLLLSHNFTSIVYFPFFTSG